MAPTANTHQVNDFPADASSRYVPRQPHNHALQNVWVSFDIGNSAILQVFILSCVLQAPPAPANGQPDGHREDIPPPIRGITGPGRAQDPHHGDVAYQGIQGIVDYHPQPFAVSDSHRSTIGPPLINDTRKIEPRICVPGCRACPRCPRTRTTRCSSAYRSMFLRYMSMTFRCR
jgi:hypothetical protein